MKIGRKEFVYLTGYSLYLAAISFIYNIAPSLSKFFKGGGICLILIALLMDPIPIKNLVFRAVVACLVAVLSIKASAFSTAIFFLFIFAFYQVSFKRLPQDRLYNPYFWNSRKYSDVYVWFCSG